MDNQAAIPKAEIIPATELDKHQENAHDIDHIGSDSKGDRSGVGSAGDEFREW
jgi:hypothetical protein